MTSLTTLLALFALFIFGGEVIKGFVSAMIWGVLWGHILQFYSIPTNYSFGFVREKTNVKFSKDFELQPYNKASVLRAMCWF